jgi:lipid II isoglutaminyl synthase (glutamine-hydrolysing)
VRVHPPSVRRLPVRAKVAVAAVRVVNWASRALGRGTGTVIGGRAGLLIDSQLVAHLLAGRDVMLISGTNGKTTTTALVRSALGGACASNLTGSNMPAGIVAALADERQDTAVLEVDEPWLRSVMESAATARRRVVVLLNLSRDQLDRASEVRQLAQRWRDIFVDTVLAKEWTVVANVNDPLVAYAVSPSPHLVGCAVPTAWLSDAASCPNCTRPLDVATTGDTPGTWNCVCGFSRPAVTAELRDTLRYGDESVELTVALPGDFNRANAALAAVAAHQWDVALDDAAARLRYVREVAGRFSVRAWSGRTWRLMLAKNPAGFAALLPVLDSSEDDIVISINSRVADGHDPAWLYDAPFELLAGRHVWCDGDRSLDLATRLDYAAMTTSLTVDASDFPDRVAGDGPIDVVANYTAFAVWMDRTTPC